MNRNKLFFVVLGMSIVSMAGCELIVDFDRTKIDGGSLDGTTPDVTTDVVVDQGNKDVVNDVTTTDASDGGTTSDASDASTTDADDGSTTADADDGSADAASE